MGGNSVTVLNGLRLPSSKIAISIIFPMTLNLILHCVSSSQIVDSLKEKLQDILKMP